MELYPSLDGKSHHIHNFKTNLFSIITRQKKSIWNIFDNFTIINKKTKHSGIKRSMQIHLFPLVCLMSIQILRHILANSTFAKSKGPWGDRTSIRCHHSITASSSRYRIFAIILSRHHTIASSHLRHCTVEVLQHHAIVITPLSSHHRSFVIALSRHPSIYMYMYPRWCDGELPGLIRIP